MPAQSGDKIGEVGRSQILMLLEVVANIHLYLILSVVEAIGEFKSVRTATLISKNFETVCCS